MDFSEQLEMLYGYAMTEGVSLALSILGAIAILIVGFWIAGAVGRILQRQLSKVDRMDPSVAGFLASIGKYLLIVATLIAVLEQFGVQTTSLVAVLGAAGLAVGLALQGTLSNVAAGVMLLIFRPFKTGQFVDVGGYSGTVKQLTLFTTELDTPDNVRIIVPNGQIWGQAITNVSFHGTRRLDIPCGIGYGEDIDKAMAVYLDAAEADARVMADPAPQCFVDTLNASSVDIVLRVWCAATDYWALKWDLTKALKQRLDAAGVEIPFPQQVVTLSGPASTADLA
ncbi:MAG: mechanosensitive ion channel family protein [Maricaulaceae bacterium]